jgi:hypothetical protein
MHHHHPHFTGERETTSRSEAERVLEAFCIYTTNKYLHSMNIYSYRTMYHSFIEQ